MTKLEEYTSNAAASLAAVEAATSDRDRAFHRRAHSIWRRLIRNIGEQEERGAQQPEYFPQRISVAAPAFKTR